MNPPLPPTRVFFVEFALPIWLRIAQDMQARYQITPVAWTAMEYMHKDFETTFPGALFLNLADVKRNVFPASLTHLEHGPFDQHCRHVWDSMSQLIYDQFHRWDRSGDFTTLQRTEHFYEALVFWNALIEELKPDAIFFRCAPHAIYDLIILGLARSRGLRTAMIHHTNIEPYLYTVADINRGRNLLVEGLMLSRWEREAGRKVEEGELSEDSKTSLKNLSRKYSEAVPWYTVSSLNVLNEGWSRRRIMESVREIIRYFRQDFKEWAKQTKDTGKSLINTGSMAKEPGRSLKDSYFGRFTRTRHGIQRLREKYLTRKLHLFYNSIATWSSADPPTPFVYLALGFQPEATSNPHADIFTQQLLMVNSVANALPTGWTLVVREHPGQVNWEFVGYLCRSRNFYSMLSKMPNVRLAPLALDPFMLIDAAEAVAVLVGTTGWQAIVRGKPVLVFGDIWYDRCEGAFRVQGYEDCCQALQTISQGFQINRQKVVEYVKSLEESTMTAGAELDARPPEIKTTESQIAGISDSVANMFGLPPPGHAYVNLRELAL